MKKFLFLLLVISLLYNNALAVVATSSADTVRPAKVNLLKSNRETFKEKIQTLRDEKKKALIIKLDEKIATTNKRRATEMTNQLQKLSDILDKISSRAINAKAEGKDTTAVEDAISEAKIALQTARTAVQTQIDKDYAIEITQKTALRQDVGKTINQLQA